MRNVLEVSNVLNLMNIRSLGIASMAALLAAGLLAQNQPDATKQEAPIEAPIHVTVQNVVVPVSVVNRNGDNVDGLKPNQFHLLDNGKEQNIRVDVTFPPISMVVAVECADRVDSMLPKIQKIGDMLQNLVVGDQGEIAVMAFDSRIRVLQGFTSDVTKIDVALKQIQAGSSQSRMIDAVEEAARMLRSRAPNRRRIILLISETRDRSSEARLRETLIEVQLSNVDVYTVDISRFVTSLMAKPDAGYIDNRPPAMTPLPMGVPATPNTVMQATGSLGGSAEFVPLMVEVFKDAKAIFKQNPSEVFTRGTGGEQYGFMRQHGLEDAIEDLGANLHSQYMISYSPNNKEQGGFHEITVEIAGRQDLKVHTRPGYWLGPQ